MTSYHGINSNTASSVQSAAARSVAEPALKQAAPDTANATERASSSGFWPFVWGSVILGTIGVFVTESHAHPMTAAWFRCALGLLGLTIWLLWRKQLSQVRLQRQHVLPVLASGVLIVASWVLFFAAIPSIGAGVGTMLFHVQPLYVMVLGSVLFHERIARHRIWSLLAAMLGLVLSTGVAQSWWQGSSSGLPDGYMTGVVYCLIGGLCWAGVVLFTRRARTVPAGVIAWWQCAVGAMTLLVWPVLNGWPQWGSAWVWLTALGLLHTGVAYSLIYSGMARLSTDRIAVLQFVYPAVALVIDWVVYDHRLGTWQWVGLLVMGVAIWWAEKPGSHTETEAKPSH